MQLAARVAIKLARENNVYIVVDADGLFLIQSDPSVVKGYRRAVLTPNVVEFGRLVEACVGFLFLCVYDLDTHPHIGFYRNSTRTQTIPNSPLPFLVLLKVQQSFKKVHKIESRMVPRLSSRK